MGERPSPLPLAGGAPRRDATRRARAAEARRETPRARRRPARSGVDGRAEADDRDRFGWLLRRLPGLGERPGRDESPGERHRLESQLRGVPREILREPRAPLHRRRAPRGGPLRCWRSSPERRSFPSRRSLSRRSRSSAFCPRPRERDRARSRTSPDWETRGVPLNCLAGSCLKPHSRLKHCAVIQKWQSGRSSRSSSAAGCADAFVGTRFATASLTRSRLMDAISFGRSKSSSLTPKEAAHRDFCESRRSHRSCSCPPL